MEINIGNKKLNKKLTVNCQADGLAEPLGRDVLRDASVIRLMTEFRLTNKKVSLAGH